MGWGGKEISNKISVVEKRVSFKRWKVDSVEEHFVQFADVLCLSLSFQGE